MIENNNHMMPLTPIHQVGYHFLVAAKSATGLVARSLGGHTAIFISLAVFLCPLFMTTLLFLGEVVGGVERLAGPKPGLPTFTASPFLRLVALGWKRYFYPLRSPVMNTPSVVPSCPKSNEVKSIKSIYVQLKWNEISEAGKLPDEDHEVWVYDGSLDDVVKGYRTTDRLGASWYVVATGARLDSPQWWADVSFPVAAAGITGIKED